MKTSGVTSHGLQDRNRRAGKVRQEPGTRRKEQQFGLATNGRPGVQRTPKSDQAKADRQIRNPNRRPGETIQLPFRPSSEQDPGYRYHAKSRPDRGLHEASIASSTTSLGRSAAEVRLRSVAGSAQPRL
jgi:hypothetical protein